MPKIPIAGGFYEDSSIQFNSQRSINMFPQINESDGGKGVAKLKNTPGLSNLETQIAYIIFPGEEFTTINTYVSSDGVLWIATSLAGNFSSKFDVWEYDPNAVGAKIINRIAYESSLEITNCSMADNGIVLQVVTGTALSWFINLQTKTSTLISDPDWPEEVFDIAYKDTYFIWLDRATDNFYISSNYADDAADCVNALDFGTVESNPDSLQGIIGIGNEIAIFGTRTIEFYYNSGNIDFPFDRNSGATQEIGTISKSSLRKVNNVVYFMGSNDAGYGIVYRMNGYQPERISTHAIERLLRENGNLENAFCYTYQLEGNYFYVVKIPDYNYYLEYNATTNLWHESFYNEDFGDINFFKPRHQNFIYNSNIFVSSFANTTPDAVISICELDPNKYSSIYYDTSAATTPQNDLNVPRIRTMPHLTEENNRIIYHKFEMDVQKGVGITSGEDSEVDPQIDLYISRDGGMTFGNPIPLFMGKITQYKWKAEAKRLGYSRDTVFKLESTSSVQQEWFQAYIDVEVLSE